VTDLRVILVGPLSILAIGIFLVAERVRPAQRRALIARGHRHDLIFTVFNVLFVAPLVTALSLSFSQLARTSLPWIVLPKTAMPRWAATALIFVLMDFCNWFRPSRQSSSADAVALPRTPSLAGGHEHADGVSHASLIHVSYLIALVPAIVLLANGALTTTLLVLYGASVAFAHSNTNLGFGPLERIFVSPNFHRIHHQLNGPQDVNLGSR
jgi:sterol desaturase/sphingolipid hydroxylase (fatty acid hydroxylase superfamily)